MKFPAGFDYNNCIPTEEDFEAVYKAKCIGDTYNTFDHKADDEYYYHTLKRYLVAILLDWKAAGKYLEDRLITYYPKPYDAEALKRIRSFISMKSDVIRDTFDKYRQKAVDIGQPEEIAQKAREERKGEITTKIKGNGNLLRLIPYSMKYGDNNPNKAQTGARMHIFFGDELSSNKYNIVIRGSNLYNSGKHGIYDQPYFTTEQEAKAFIANFDHSHLNTIVTIDDWRWAITDAHIDDGYTRDAAGNYVKDWFNPKLTDAVKVDTVCGPAYMLKDLLDDWKARQAAWKAEQKAKRKAKNENLEVNNMNENIEKHDTLNPKLFDDFKLKPEVREKAEEIVNKLLGLLAQDEIKIEVRDVILAGSNASFNYTENSDVDLHIVAKTVDLNDPDKLYPKIYDAYRRLFESKFDISFYGIPVETFIETEANAIVSNGIYSVMFDQWVKKPEQTYVPDIDQAAIDKAAKPWLNRANRLLKELDDNMPDGEEQIDQFMDDLYEMRQRGIYHTEGSEFSEENLIFKEVRNSGAMDKLKELKNKIVSKKLSLEEGIKYLDDDHEFKDYGTADIKDKDVIDTHKASTFATQDLLDGSIDTTYDGVVYDIITLTPTQYFELCGKVQDMKPEEIIDFIGADERQLTHIKDVILKFGKKLPLPYISFSANPEVSGQEGRHRMYALGEMYGWDEEFPVMLIQDASNRKAITALLNEAILEDFRLSEKDRRDYVIKITQLTHYQPVMQTNGIFELYNVKEDDAEFIINILRREPWIEYIQKSADRYDFSKIAFNGIASRYYKMLGKIRIK